MAGKHWTEEETQDLISSAQKKPPNEPLIDWSERYATNTRWTAHAIRAKVNELRRTMKQNNDVPRILLFDIETLPIEAYVWDLKPDYIQPENIIRDWCISCWSAKWLGEAEVISFILKPDEARERKDERILHPLWRLLDKADIVIAQNGKSFDIKRANTRFLLYGMDEPMPYRVVDTLQSARAKFDFSSFKLDYMNKYLGLNIKHEVHMNDWIGCSQGNKDSLKKMQEYNKQDVLILEEFYYSIRRWINHPNMVSWCVRVVELEDGEEMCPVCGEIVTDSAFSGEWVSPAGYRYSAFRCPHCGAIGRRTERNPGQNIAVKKT